MSQVYEDDSWKNAQAEPDIKFPPNITRAQMQAKINQAYMNGDMTRVEWSRKFEDLSANWNAHGPIKVKVKVK